MTKKYLILIFLLSLVVEIFPQAMKTRKWRRTEVDSLNNALLLYDEGNYLLALPIFDNLYNHHPSENFLKYSYGKCALYRSDKYDVALKMLEEVYEKNKKIADIDFDLARAYHYNYQFDKADEKVNNYLNQKRLNPESKAKAQLLKKYIQNAKYFYATPTKAIVKNIGTPINTIDDEYVPVISADEATMIYTYRGRKSIGGRQNAFLQPDSLGIFYEDVYIAEKTLNQWADPQPLGGINTNAHDAAIALSNDGTMLFIYKDDGITHGDIFISHNIGYNQYTPPVKLKGLVNTFSWEGSCSLSADGRTLYFSSEKPGGFGGKDIYKATMLPDSTWGNIVNLGDSINTPYDEDAPFIHPDGTTLYYSSKGKNSIGDYDIFVAYMNVQDSTFKHTENLGYPINTPGDDIYFVLSANGEHGYYSSGRPDGIGLKDIYMIETNFEKKPLTMLVSGKVFYNDKPTASTISVYIIDNGVEKLYYQTKSFADNGKYLFTLPAGHDFKINCVYSTDINQAVNISTKNLTAYSEKKQDFYLSTISNTVAPVTNTTVPTNTVAITEKTTAPTPTNNIVPNQPKKSDCNIKVDESKLNAMQKKVLKYAMQYCDISAEGLEFRVQVAAYKHPKNYKAPYLKGLGKLEKLILNDGVTRITIGGKFKSLGAAFKHNIKVIKAGQKDAFVTAIYKGKRVYLEDLVKLGIFPQN